MLGRTPLMLLIASAPLVVAGVVAFAQAGPADPVDAPPPAAAAGDERPFPARFGRGHGHHPGGFERSGAMRGLFREVDADGDGVVTLAEIDAFRAAQLAAADTDGDGAVSLDEFAVVYFERTRPMMVDAFQAFDQDGDGLVTEAEISDRIDAAVSRLDRDGDGELRLREGGPRGHRG